VPDPLALLLAAVLLAATLAAAAADSPRLPPAVVAVPGALLLVLLGAVSWQDTADTVREVAPTVAFLVVVLLLAELADREGLFTWSAALTARQAGSSATRLLTRVTVLAAVVTAVLSLDATVVLLTPVVVATALRMRVPVRPHGYAVGHLANSASLLLPVSNLTNLLAVAATGLSFVHFAGLMVLPQLATVALEYLVLRWLFRRDLRGVVDVPLHDVPGTPVLALVVVGGTVLGFGIASLVGLPPVWPAAVGVLVLGTRQLATRRTTLREQLVAANLPFGLFVVGLAVLVLVLQLHGLESLLHAVLPDGDGLLALLAVAGISALLANLVNNLPATLALVPVAAVGGVPTVLAMLIGVNLGPNLTYAGSLANLLWRRVLGEHAPGTARFSAVGLATVPLTMIAATTALWAALLVT
jgi:arsenical pump membrane protein